jgi:hypothetical protein
MRSAMMRPLVIAALCSAAVAAQDKLPSADAVLRELQSGNAHHVAKRYQHPHQTAARQRELAATQNPHAIVLSCADSRVAPEIVLDQGLGDLFDVRVAGNVASDTELASIEYRGALTVVGAVYSLDTGKVAWLAENHTRTVAWREAPRRPPQCAGGRRAEQVARQPAGGVVASRDLQRTTTDRGPAR